MRIFPPRDGKPTPSLRRARPARAHGPPTTPARSYFALIGTAVVDSGDAGLVPRNVVQRRLDDVRLGAEIGHPRRNGPAQIMQFPRGHLVADARVQLALGCFPLRKAESRSLAKQLIAPRHAWNCGDDVERRLRQRQHVCSSVFAPRGRQRPRPYVQFDLGPAQAADLGATGASEDQELDRLSESVITTGVPDRGQLAIGQHARAWHGILRLERSDNGICSQQGRGRAPKRRARTGQHAPARR